MIGWVVLVYDLVNISEKIQRNLINLFEWNINKVDSPVLWKKRNELKYFMQGKTKLKDGWASVQGKMYYTQNSSNWMLFTEGFAGGIIFFFGVDGKPWCGLICRSDEEKHYLLSDLMHSFIVPAHVFAVSCRLVNSFIILLFAGWSCGFSRHYTGPPRNLIWNHFYYREVWCPGYYFARKYKCQDYGHYFFY